MIFTCTLNPSMDYIVWLDQLNIGDVNRTKKEHLSPGGKGINVSLLLENIKVKSTAIGFVGGFVGELFLKELEQYQYIHKDFVKVNDNTRINVIIQEQDETRINAGGPSINNEAYLELIHKVKNIKEHDYVILSGSIPNSIKADLYGEIAKIVNENKGILVVDTTKDQLLNLLKYQPFLIKPNQAELEEFFHVKINDHQEIIHYASLLKKMGAQNVLVSLGGDGAILVTNDQILHANTAKEKVINSVGAGDSMVAGFVAKYLETNSFAEALRYGSACGGATAYSLGMGEEELINRLYSVIEVKELA